ncbi:hypothetical protein BDZ45DRAFT_743467 [Acephala macrosclerotiorum]|nr:hypothetical protein BDZ45DRAFT_743467 [Acephala macrosclerotiorum]
MDHGSTDQANGDLQNQLSGGPNVGGNSACYSVQRSTVAFVRNKDSYSAQVFGGAAETGAEHVTSTCGWNIAGTWRMDGFKGVDFGYMDAALEVLDLLGLRMKEGD